MTGISLSDGARVIAFHVASRESASVVTLSGSSEVLPGTESIRAKITPLREFPPKGRATSGVRAHTFLKGEDHLVSAFVGNHPLALGAKGQAIVLPDQLGKRDGSGSTIEGTVMALGEALVS